MLAKVDFQPQQTYIARFVLHRAHTTGNVRFLIGADTESQNIPLENWLSRPGSPSELPAHQTPAPDPTPWARSSPGSPTGHKAEPR